MSAASAQPPHLRTPLTPQPTTQSSAHTSNHQTLSTFQAILIPKMPRSRVVYPLSTQKILDLISYTVLRRLLARVAQSVFEPSGARLRNRQPQQDEPSTGYVNDMQCTIQPGVNWVKLNQQLAAHLLFLCMMGTCCSGLSALRYGTVRIQVSTSRWCSPTVPCSTRANAPSSPSPYLTSTRSSADPRAQ